MRPYRVGIMGMGGFAAVHHGAVHQMETEGIARLVCVCDPCPEQFPELMDDLLSRGVDVSWDYREMLQRHSADLDVAVISTPVQLHAPMHAAAVSHGLAVYLEKPPSLCHRELEQMIAADAEAACPSVVGFNFIGDPTRRRLRSELLAGRFGDLLELRLFAFAPRRKSYYRRSDWVARLLMDGRPVLDSCIGNCFAHYLQNMLFWGGTGEYGVADVRAVRAQLYRAHPIESFDTVFLAAELEPTGFPLKLVASHIGKNDSNTWEEVVCKEATIRCSSSGNCEIRWADGRIEEVPTAATPAAGNQRRNYDSLFRSMTGEMDRPTVTLADCRPFVALNDLAFLSSGQITTIASPHARVYNDRDDVGVEVQGLPEAGEHFLDTGLFPEVDTHPWAGPAPGTVTMNDLADFDEQWVAGLLSDRA